jgi:hypothetical protein
LEDSQASILYSIAVVYDTGGKFATGVIHYYRYRSFTYKYFPTVYWIGWILKYGDVYVRSVSFNHKSFNYFVLDTFGKES